MENKQEEQSTNNVQIPPENPQPISSENMPKLPPIVSPREEIPVGPQKFKYIIFGGNHPENIIEALNRRGNFEHVFLICAKL